jgi:hypothetical protein
MILFLKYSPTYIVLREKMAKKRSYNTPNTHYSPTQHHTHKPKNKKRITLNIQQRPGHQQGAINLQVKQPVDLSSLLHLPSFKVQPPPMRLLLCQGEHPVHSGRHSIKNNVIPQLPNGTQP